MVWVPALRKTSAVIVRTWLSYQASMITTLSTQTRMPSSAVAEKR